MKQRVNFEKIASHGLLALAAAAVAFASLASRIRLGGSCLVDSPNSRCDLFPSVCLGMPVR